ncbi:hypothetical protein [Bifidobacterium longum]|uniref:hypothetical protein n=1 Tax=Bifidobacterium longum TaxID=216816 RepID=UPI00163DE5C1|nr:hypothetical protein [Bifidobacterium longum]
MLPRLWTARIMRRCSIGHCAGGTPPRVLIAVLAVLLYRRMGMITPLIVAHGMYDVSAAMTNLTGIAGSSWSLVVGLAIMAMPVVWAIVRCAR